jgi:AhpD family alkylhydroperoxidase
MDDRIKELIAIGASVAGHCQPCLTYHVTKARDIGIEEDEISEAIDVGHMVEKGAMSAMRDFAKGVMDAPAGKASDCCTGRSKKGAGCCA